jgi:hypothetical protein
VVMLTVNKRRCCGNGSPPRNQQEVLIKPSQELVTTSGALQKALS